MITSTPNTAFNRVTTNSIGISPLQSFQTIANSFFSTDQLSSHTIQSSQSLQVIPTTSSAFGITSSLQVNVPPPSFLLQTLASTISATIQTSTPFPKSNDTFLSLLLTNTRTFSITSERGRLSPPSFPTSLDQFYGNTETSIRVPGTTIKITSFSLISTTRNEAEVTTSNIATIIQTLITVSSTIDSSFLSLKSTSTREIGTSVVREVLPSPSLQAMTSSSGKTVQTTIASSGNDQSLSSLKIVQTRSEAYSTPSTLQAIEHSLSLSSTNLFSGNPMRPTPIQSMIGELPTSHISTMTGE